MNQLVCLEMFVCIAPQKFEYILYLFVKMQHRCYFYVYIFIYYYEFTLLIEVIRYSVWLMLILCEHIHFAIF